MHDPYDLQRFIAAQELVYPRVCAELQHGRKLTHWMWFIFPQLEGLGYSAMTQRYAIASRAEAVAYLQHEILGKRLRECTEWVNAVERKSLTQILGQPDAMKFHSSMTLFALTATDNALFDEALHRYFAGEPDRQTLQKLQAAI